MPPRRRRRGRTRAAEGPPARRERPGGRRTARCEGWWAAWSWSRHVVELSARTGRVEKAQQLGVELGRPVERRRVSRVGDDRQPRAPQLGHILLFARRRR